MTLDELKAIKDAGMFHHATYRNQGTLWEGLWVYQRNQNGFRGYEVVGAFLKDNPELEGAEKMIAGTGISVGSYGNG